MIIDRLRKEFEFFKSLHHKDLLDFLTFCESRRVAVGETIWKEGDNDNYAAFILSGLFGHKKENQV